MFVLQNIDLILTRRGPDVMRIFTPSIDQLSGQQQQPGLGADIKFVLVQCSTQNCAPPPPPSQAKTTSLF